MAYELDLRAGNYMMRQRGIEGIFEEIANFQARVAALQKLIPLLTEETRDEAAKNWHKMHAEIVKAKEFVERIETEEPRLQEILIPMKQCIILSVDFSEMVNDLLPTRRRIAEVKAHIAAATKNAECAQKLALELIAEIHNLERVSRVSAGLDEEYGIVKKSKSKRWFG
jgi:hypothetical protein